MSKEIRQGQAPLNWETGDFQKIYETYFPRIAAYLRRMVGEHDAEDLAQEVFVKVSMALDNFRGDSTLATWIYQIATNTARDHLRKLSSAQASRVLDNSPDDMEEIMEDARPVTDTMLIRKEMNDCIRETIDSLPENYRAVLLLSDIEGLTNIEIAEALDMTLENVKIRLRRARARLKKELGEKCQFYHDERNELACDRKPPTIKFRKM
jgi:RNA polymerase sigma-70 factor (ECF subfamily)